MPATLFDPSRFPSEIDPRIRNDASMSPAEVIAKLKIDGVEINYGNLCMVAERHSLEHARAHVSALTPEQRHNVMQSVDRALRKYKPKVLKGTASKKRMDAFHSDLLVWTALREQTQN